MHFLSLGLCAGVDGLRMDVINFISKAPGYPEGRIHGNAKYSVGSPYFVNGPRVHEFLQEMNEQVLRHYNIVTIGECPGRCERCRRKLSLMLSFRCQHPRCGIVQLSTAE
jgi:glycosidase